MSILNIQNSDAIYFDDPIYVQENGGPVTGQLDLSGLNFTIDSLLVDGIPVEVKPLDDLPRVLISTSLGDMVLELAKDRAPITVENFLRYVDDGYYSNTVFHRVISNFMVQGGGFILSNNSIVPKGGTYAPIVLERTTVTGLSNLAGTVAMARTSVENSATSQFYINTVDNLFLDGTPNSPGYAVFGRVVAGADTTLQALRAVQVLNNGAGEVSLPATPPIILDVSRVPTSTTAGAFSLSTLGEWVINPSDEHFAYLAEGEIAEVEVSVSYQTSSGSPGLAVYPVIVEGKNDSPVIEAIGDFYVNTNHVKISGMLKASDIDRGDILVYSIKNGPIPGFEIRPDGYWSFDPSVEMYSNLGSTSRVAVEVIYTVTDQFGGMDEDSFNIFVSGEGFIELTGERLIGTSNNDTLNGGEWDDWIDGLGGNDSLVGGLGNDSIFGGAGNDRIFGDQGNDLIIGGDGRDVIYAGDGDDYIDSSTGDPVTESSGDWIIPGRGNDTIVGNQGIWNLPQREGIDISWSNLPSSEPVRVAVGVDGIGFATSLVGETLSQSFSYAHFFSGTGGNDVFIGSDNPVWEGWEPGAGSDFVDGGAGPDELLYDGEHLRGGTDGISINFSTGVAVDPFGSIDLFRGIERVRGTPFSDIFFGSEDMASVRYRGLNGADLIYGTAGYDIADYSRDSSSGGLFGINGRLEVGEIVDGFGSIDIVSDIDQVIGTKFSDWISGDDEPNALDGLGGDDFLSGGGGGDRLYGDSGNDTLIGGGGFDIARYENSPAGIVVDMRLANNQVQDGFGSLDKLSGIEGFIGSSFADLFVGPDDLVSDFYVEGRAGADSIKGGSGAEIREIVYTGDPAGVVVRLRGHAGDLVDLPVGYTGSAIDGYGFIDLFTEITGVEGSAFNDKIFGDSGDNRLDGRGGDDTLDGGSGTDWVEYNQSIEWVHIDLSLGNALRDGFGGTDLLVGIENVLGSQHDDYIVGDNGANTLEGTGGDDTLDGGYGSDLAVYSGIKAEYSFLKTSSGEWLISDTVTNRDGSDLLRRIEAVQFSDGVVSLESGPNVGISGIAYHWKSHTLLDKVAVRAVDQGAVSDAPTQLFDLRSAALDQTTGKLTVEVWANPEATVETIDFTAAGPAGSTLTFTSALGTDWTPLTNTSQPGQLLLGAYLSNISATGLTVPTRVGTLEVQLAAGTSDVQIAFSEIQVGASSVPDLALGMAGATTGADGAFEFTTLPAGDFGLSATRAAGDGTNGVTSADALAALRLAVGINPNPDPDGTGPQQALKVSPYQFMAADANQDGKVSAADALAILRMAVRLPTALPQEWFFVEETRDLWNEITGQSALTRTAATWDRGISATAPGEVNLVGVLKGDVNGSWTAPTGAQDLDVLEPGYFADLTGRIGAPMDQFGVYSGG